MKYSSIKNLFEFKDTKSKRALKNLISNVGKLQGLGLPDLCYITKKMPKGFFRSGFEEESSFHFVQGLCPDSEQDISMYMQSILKDQSQLSNNFNKEIMIDTIVYATYDAFSKTLILCQMDQFSKGGHQFQLQAVKENLQFIEISELHWQGAYVSGILRAINPNLEMPMACKFFNELKLNPDRLALIIQKLFTLTQRNYDLMKVCSKSQFPSLDDLIYYLNWPLFVLFRHLAQSKQLDILLKQIKSLEENTTVIYIKAIIFYKTKNYQLSLSELLKLSNNIRQFNVTKYLLAKVYIKLRCFDKAFLLLTNILQDTLEHQIVWTTLVKILQIQASIFRKKQFHEISFILLNKAAGYIPEKQITLFEKLQNLQNFQFFCECKQIKNPKSLNKIYSITKQNFAQQIECFVQLSGHPNLDGLWMKNCASKKQIIVEQIKKHLQKPRQSIKRGLQSLFMNNELALCEHQNEFLKETLKLTNSLDNQQIKKIFIQLFHLPTKIVDFLQQPCADDYKLVFSVIQEKDIEQQKFHSQKSSIDNQKRTVISKMPNTMFNRRDQKISKNKSALIAGQQSVIVENSFESFESDIENEGDNPEQQNQPYPLQCGNLFGFFQYLDHDLTEAERHQLTKQIQNRKEIVNPLFSYTIDNICKVSEELESVFIPARFETKYSAITETLQNESPGTSDILRSNLNKTQQSRIHILTKYQIKDFYFFESVKNTQNLENLIKNSTKTESGFLYKCALIAIKLQKYELAIELLQKMSSKMISVQVYAQMFDLLVDQHEELLLIFQKALLSFSECGIQTINTIPIWIQKPFTRLIVTVGPIKVKELLQKLQCDFAQELLKQEVFRYEF